MQTFSRKTHMFDLVREHAFPVVLRFSSFGLVGKVIWFFIYQLPYYIFLEQLFLERRIKYYEKTFESSIKVLSFFKKNVVDRTIIPVTRQQNILVSVPMVKD